MQVIRAFLLFEAVTFAIASLFHSGVVIDGYADTGASTAEGVIAIVLAIGLAATFAFARWTRLIGLLAQAFGIVGTSIGLFLLSQGLAPDTAPDIVFHIGIYVVLWIGFVFAWRYRRVSQPVGR